MPDPTILLPTLLHTVQAAVSAYTLWPEYNSITKIQTYEEKTKKLAKISNTADWHLWQTRKTLGFSTVSTVASLLASSSFVIGARSLNPRLKLLVSWALAVMLMTSHAHVSGYWSKSPKVPLSSMQNYNDSISITNYANRLIKGLAFSWGVLGLVYWYLTFIA